MANKSKPQHHKGSADKPSPSEYTAKPNPGARPGEWQGRYVPKKAVAAAKFLAKKGVPEQYFP